MTDNFSFVNEHWFWPVIILAGLLWLLFLYKEMKQRKGTSLWVNIFVGFIAISSLVGLALKPMIPSIKTTDHIVLLTEGFSSETLDSIQKNYKRIKTFNYQPGRPIFEKGQRVKSVFLLGYGVEEFDLWQLADMKVNHIQREVPTGVVQVKFNELAYVGDLLQVKALLNSPNKGDKVFLEGPAGGKLDSTIITVSKDTILRLVTGLKTSGNYQYRLKVTDSIGVIKSNDPVSVRVGEKQLLKILLINAFPSFESKYLKNFLAEEGHQLTVRSRLTQGRYKYEYFNQSERASIIFTNESLKSYDLIIIDPTSLRSLSSSAKMAVENNIREEGLGLFIQPEPSLYTANMPMLELDFTRRNIYTDKLESWPTTNIGKFGYKFNKVTGLEPAVTSINDTLVAYHRLENGRIGSSLLQNTFELFLNGETDVYRFIWTETIDAIAKKEKRAVSWSSQNKIPVVNEPYEFQLRTSAENPIVTFTDHQRIALKQDINERQLWTGIFYPNRTGWHQFKAEEDIESIHDFFVIDTTQWRSKRQYETRKENQRRFAQQESTEILETKFLKAINPLWFFIIFLLSIGYLWLEPKI